MTGVAFGSLAVAGWRLYGRRSPERHSQPGGHRRSGRARAYGRIMRLPHMALLRRFVARRAAAGRRGRGGRSRLRPRLSGHRAGASRPVARNGHRSVRRHAVPGDRQRPAGWRDASDRLPHRRRRRAALPRRFAGPGGEHPVAASLGRPGPHFQRSCPRLRPGGAFLLFDLRRDLGPAPWLLFWFATHVVVPPALRHIGEPLGSRNAAYTPEEAAGLLQTSRLTGWRVARGPFWLSIEGHTV